MGARLQLSQQASGRVSCVVGSPWLAWVLSPGGAASMGAPGPSMHVSSRHVTGPHTQGNEAGRKGQRPPCACATVAQERNASRMSRSNVPPAGDLREPAANVVAWQAHTLRAGCSPHPPGHETVRPKSAPLHQWQICWWETSHRARSVGVSGGAIASGTSSCGRETSKTAILVHSPFECLRS